MRGLCAGNEPCEGLWVSLKLLPFREASRSAAVPAAARRASRPPRRMPSGQPAKPALSVVEGMPALHKSGMAADCGPEGMRCRAESSTVRRVIPSGAGSLASDPVKSRDLLSLSCPEVSARSGRWRRRQTAGLSTPRPGSQTSPLAPLKMTIAGSWHRAQLRCTGGPSEVVRLISPLRLTLASSPV